MGLKWRKESGKSATGFTLKGDEKVLREIELSWRQGPQDTTLANPPSFKGPIKEYKTPEDTRNAIVMSHNASQQKNYDEAFVRLHQDPETSKMYWNLIDSTEAGTKDEDWHGGPSYWTNRERPAVDAFTTEEDYNKAINKKAGRDKGYMKMKKWVEGSIRKDPDKTWGQNKLDKYRRLTISLYILGNYPRLFTEVGRSPSYTMYKKWVKKNGK